MTNEGNTEAAPEREIDVLIHLNITVTARSDEEAEQLASDYLYRHNIPVSDVADIEALI
jgi:hypothetical protein